MNTYKILTGCCLTELRKIPEKSIHCCVTSPPYFGLRDYGVDGQIGLEPTPEQFVETMVAVFREVRRVLRDDGVLWVNLGDSFGTKNLDGIKPKDLMLIPTTVAAALRDDGWYLRDAVIWHKPNPMPTSQQDRCTFAYEYVFQLTKSKRYYFDMERVREDAVDGYKINPNQAALKGRKAASSGMWRNAGSGDVPVERGQDQSGAYFGEKKRIPRNVWTISTQGFKEAHFATYPEKLLDIPIKSSTSEVGCCPACGTPHKRIVEKVRRPTRPGEKTKVKMPDGWDTGDGGHGSFHRDGREKGEYRETAEVGNRDPERHVTETVTTGWTHDCECGDLFDPVPCTVLDPFCGSGTSGVVAMRYGNDFVGIELNPEYTEIAHRRIGASINDTQQT